MSASRRLVVTELLDAPALSLGIFGVGAAHVALSAIGRGGWPCPFYHTTGWPCPGCGLGRACVLLLHGHWKESLRVHAYAPILLLTLALLGAGLVLRGRAKAALRAGVKWAEERLRLSVILLWGLLLYWLLGFMLDGSQWRLIVH